MALYSLFWIIIALLLFIALVGVIAVRHLCHINNRLYFIQREMSELSGEAEERGFFDGGRLE